MVRRQSGTHLPSDSAKKLSGWTDKRGTRWKICALCRLVDMCQFAGDMDPASTPNEEWKATACEEERNQIVSIQIFVAAISDCVCRTCDKFPFCCTHIYWLRPCLLAIPASRSPVVPVLCKQENSTRCRQWASKAGDRIISELDGESIVERFEELSRRKVYADTGCRQVQIDS